MDREPVTQIPIIDGVARAYASDTLILNIVGADYRSTKVMWNRPLGEIDRGAGRAGAEYFGEAMRVELVPNVNGTSVSSLYAAPSVNADGNWDNGGNPFLFIKHKTATDPRESDFWMTVPIGNADMLYEGLWLIAPYAGLTTQTAPASEYYMGLAEEAGEIITQQFEADMLLDFTVGAGLRKRSTRTTCFTGVTQATTTCHGGQLQSPEPGRADRPLRGDHGDVAVRPARRFCWGNVGAYAALRFRPRFCHFTDRWSEVVS